MSREFLYITFIFNVDIGLKLCYIICTHATLTDFLHAQSYPGTDRKVVHQRDFYYNVQ